MKNGGEAFERVWSAADALFEQGDRSVFPTVDAVRKAAQVNMNDASTAMREWRQRQIDKAKRSDLPVPIALERSFRQALEAMWSAAQSAAGQALDEAQGAWDVERQEAQTLTGQMGEAFDAQSREMQAARENLEALERQRRELQAQNEDLQMQLVQCQADATRAEAGADQAVIKAEEAERRAADLRQELDHAHMALAERIKLDDGALERERSNASLAREEAITLKRELTALRGQPNVRRTTSLTRIPLTKTTARRRLRKGTKHSESLYAAKGGGDERPTHSAKSQWRRVGHS